MAATKRLKFNKVLVRDNPADLYTKHLDWDTIARHCSKLSAHFEGGRASTAPELHTLDALWDMNEDAQSLAQAVHMLESQTMNTTQYTDDDLGPLQPIMSIHTPTTTTTTDITMNSDAIGEHVSRVCEIKLPKITNTRNSDAQGEQIARFGKSKLSTTTNITMNSDSIGEQVLRFGSQVYQPLHQPLPTTTNIRNSDAQGEKLIIRFGEELRVYSFSPPGGCRGQNLATKFEGILVHNFSPPPPRLSSMCAHICERSVPNTNYQITTTDHQLPITKNATIVPEPTQSMPRDEPNQLRRGIPKHPRSRGPKLRLGQKRRYRVAWV